MQIELLCAFSKAWSELGRINHKFFSFADAADALRESLSSFGSLLEDFDECVPMSHVGML
jgi:hypothetical protein